MEHTWTKDFYQETDPAKRRGGSLGRRIQNPALDSPIRTAQAPEG